jgi:hypothetical protein
MAVDAAHSISDDAASAPSVLILLVAFGLSFDNANATHEQVRAERADSIEEIRCDA